MYQNSVPICVRQSINLEEFQNKTGFLDLRHEWRWKSELTLSYPVLIGHDIARHERKNHQWLPRIFLEGGTNTALMAPSWSMGITTGYVGVLIKKKTKTADGRQRQRQAHLPRCKQSAARLGEAFIQAYSKRKREFGATCFIAPENQDETLNVADGCIHHRLTPSSGGDETLDQTSWLSPFVTRDLKYDGFAFLLFLNVHMLC